MKFNLKWVFSSLIIPSIAFLISCSPDSVYLQQAPDPKGSAKVKGSAKFTPQVDVLIVVDDSGSMGTYQDKLKKNVNSFVKEISKSSSLDYHIGVLTTTADDRSSLLPGQSGNLVRSKANNVYYVEKSTPNGLSILEDNLLVGTNGSASEKIFDPIYLALSAPAVRGMNRGFYRSNAYLATIFITDAEDQSTIMSSAESFYTFLLGLKNNDPTKILSYGAIIPVNKVTTSTCLRDGSIPTKLERFFQLANSNFNENWFDICSSDYGPKLAQLAKNLVRKVSKYIYLDQIPDIQTVTVKYGNKQIPNDEVSGWTFDPSRNAIVLSDTLNWDNLTQGKAGQLEVDFTPADIIVK